ncbi:MAG: flagellar hook capping FlgD N-terminal domain-containing protein [bacterium]
MANAIDTSYNVDPTNTNTNLSTNAMDGLDRNTFINLLLTEIKYQDPLKPMDNKDMIAQLAQFSALEQTQQLNTKMDSMSSTMDSTKATSMLGHKVVVQGVDDQTPSTGNVTAIMYDGTTPNVVVNGKSYPLTGIQRIE